MTTDTTSPTIPVKPGIPAGPGPPPAPGIGEVADHQAGRLLHRTHLTLPAGAFRLLQGPSTLGTPTWEIT
jgi:hypothetical protein